MTFLDTLNSNLILLILFQCQFLKHCFVPFKFQSDSINTGSSGDSAKIGSSFKFQSDSINTMFAMTYRQSYPTLNSNLILLILQAIQLNAPFVAPLNSNLILLIPVKNIEVGVSDVTLNSNLILLIRNYDFLQ